MSQRGGHPNSSPPTPSRFLKYARALQSWTGVVGLPPPSWPSLSAPQQCTLPSFRNAHVWAPPASMDATSEKMARR
jgi:hypothetical protein